MAPEAAASGWVGPEAVVVLSTATGACGVIFDVCVIVLWCFCGVQVVGMAFGVARSYTERRRAAVVCV